MDNRSCDSVPNSQPTNVPDTESPNHYYNGYDSNRGDTDNSDNYSNYY